MQRVGVIIRKTIDHPSECTRNVGISGDNWRISGVEKGEATMICVNGLVLGLKSSGLLDNKFERL
jgi:hypothetical protein